MVTGVVPSVYVKFQGGVPVRVTDAEAAFPLQIVVEPLIIAVGNGLTLAVITLLSAGLIVVHTTLEFNNNLIWFPFESVLDEYVVPVAPLISAHVPVRLGLDCHW